MGSALLEVTSQQFLGQWQRLVSTTNWDKGRIIHEWRTALETAGVPAAEFSDDAWSRQVGNVTPQHVGRLRRVFERFSSQRDDFPGLFWSHFQATLDWHDAEMWLEGAVQNDWSIAQMRRQRWEAMGAVEGLTPGDDDAIGSEWDEDSEPHSSDVTAPTVSQSIGLAHGADGQARGVAESDTDEKLDDGPEGAAQGHDENDSDDQESAIAPIRPFAALAALPADVSAAFDAFKLCILRHKLAGWAELSRVDLLASLDALKELALAPSRA